MNEILLIAVAIIVIIILGILFWLLHENKKLKQRFNILSSFVERNNKDIAGLCLAAVSVDGKLSASNEQIKGIVDKVTDFEKHEPLSSGNQPYYEAIQQVKRGAKVEDLIRQCGLSRDEADLLIRLHG